MNALLVLLISSLCGAHAIELECDACVFLMTLAESTINGTTAEIFSRFDEVCKALPSNTVIDKAVSACARSVALTNKCLELAELLAKQAPSVNFFIKQREYTPLDCCLFVSVCNVECCISDAPEQVHIALTGDITQMSVTWVTPTSITATPTVNYGTNPNSLDMTVTGKISTYTSVISLKYESTRISRSHSNAGFGLTQRTTGRMAWKHQFSNHGWVASVHSLLLQCGQHAVWIFQDV